MENATSPAPGTPVAVLPDPPLPYDSLEQAQIEGGNSLLEKIKSASKGVFEKHGVIFKRGRGRPKLDGTPKASDVPLNAPASALPAATATPDPNFDPALVKRCVSAVAKAVSGFLDKLLYSKALRATQDPGYSKQVVADTSITVDELNSFSELAEICLKKYGVGSEYCPEIGLAFIGAGIGIRYAHAIQRLNAELKQKENTQAQ